MFKKQFKVTGNTKLKKALLKKVLINAEKSLPMFQELEEEEIAKLIPVKCDRFDATRLKGTRASFYSYKDVPVFIDLNGKGSLVPTVFGLWLVPNQILTLTVDDGAFPHILNGAELMAPGVRCAIEDFPDFEENEAVAIQLPCGKAVAIGYFLIDLKELKRNGKRGRLVHIEHIVGDLLFEHAWTSSPSPHCSLPEELEHLRDILKLPARADIVQEEVEGEATAEPVEEAKETETKNEGEVGEETKREEEEEEEEEEQEIEVRPMLSMDEIISLSFFQGLKKSLNTDDLPISGSVFYSLHMQPNRPRGTKIDIKRSSYKKLAKFLQSMSREGIINIKPLPKGELQITKVNDKHEKYVEFEPYKVAKAKNTHVSDNDAKGAKGGQAEEKGFRIAKMLRPTADQFPIFATIKPTALKTDLYSRPDAVEFLWKYVGKNNLSAVGIKTVEVDDVLSRAVFRNKIKKGETVSKEELSIKFVGSLQENFELYRNGVTGVVKGKLPIIEVREEKRGGHKFVTKVKGLETYLLTPKDVAKQLRKKFAASTTVNDIPVGKGKGSTVFQEVIVQGKMNHQIKDFLVKQHEIPAKYIELFAK